jgi:glycosyltransferase involved in cell wall biosynthesis
MLTKQRMLALFIALSGTATWTNVSHAKDKNFVIIVTSFNNKDNGIYQKNLDSIFSQTYPNYRVIYVDDASTDGNYEAVQSYIEQHKLKHKITLTHTTQRVGAHKNIWDAAHTCDPHEIIVIVDGDDWFYDETVLDHLNKVYQDPNVWLTYGQFIQWPSGKPGTSKQLPYEVIAAHFFREYWWLTSHLRTFYAALYHKIKYEDMLYKDGNFITRAGDVAIMYPMLEMAGFHSKFIDKILYVYNGTANAEDAKNSTATNKKNPLNNIPHDKVYWYLKKKAKYPRLDRLF